MLTAANLMAIALLLPHGHVDGGLDQVAVVAAPAAPAEARRGEEPTSRRVCRMERATGSNMQQRVCRQVPRQGFQDQQTREFMRSHQRIRMPDGGAAPTPGGPNG